MFERKAWVARVEAAWRKRPLVWLSGVRRVGKTTLAKMLPDVEYFNCELPSVRRQLDDPEELLRSAEPGSRLVFDEIHRLDDPSLVLKIAADEFPGIRVLATGSSTLAATRKFRDSLAGRRRLIHLPPVLWSECETFGVRSLGRRLQNGGLPDHLLAREPDAEDYGDWIDSFYARDIHELFAVRNRVGFMTLFRLLLRQSGGQIDYTALAKHAELSRPTTKAYVEAMSIAHGLFLLPPFAGAGRREIVRRPKAYAFDTGFVAFERGWGRLRAEDKGALWEHLALDMLRVQVGDRDLHYWRDKSGREVDFVISRRGKRIDAVEAKVDAGRFDPTGLIAFRKLYPEGDNYVLAPGIERPYVSRAGGLRLRNTSTYAP